MKKKFEDSEIPLIIIVAFIVLAIGKVLGWW